jgi:hypothetical protein
MKQMSLSRLTNLQLSTFSTNFIEIITKSKAEGAQAGKLYDELVMQDEQLSSAVNRTRYSELTKELNSIGAERNKITTGMKGVLRNLKKSPIKEESEAATLLFSTLSELGTDLIRDVQGKQTAAVKSLLGTLTKEEYADAIARTNLQNWISHLDELQSTYVTTNNLRNSHQRSINESQSASSLRPNLSDAVNKYYAWTYGQSLSLDLATWTTLNADLLYCYKKAISDATTKTADNSGNTASDSSVSSTTDTSKQPE